jgi:hypothetical protein
MEYIFAFTKYNSSYLVFSNKEYIQPISYKQLSLEMLRNALNISIVSKKTKLNTTKFLKNAFKYVIDYCNGVGIKFDNDKNIKIDCLKILIKLKICNKTTQRLSIMNNISLSLIGDSRCIICTKLLNLCKCVKAYNHYHLCRAKTKKGYCKRKVRGYNKCFQHKHVILCEPIFKL